MNFAGCLPPVYNYAIWLHSCGLGVDIRQNSFITWSHHTREGIFAGSISMWCRINSQQYCSLDNIHILLDGNINNLWLPKCADKANYCSRLYLVTYCWYIVGLAHSGSEVFKYKAGCHQINHGTVVVLVSVMTDCLQHSMHVLVFCWPSQLLYPGDFIVQINVSNLKQGKVKNWLHVISRLSKTDTVKPPNKGHFGDRPFVLCPLLGGFLLESP